MSLSPAEKQKRYRDRKRDPKDPDSDTMKNLNLYISRGSHVALRNISRHTGRPIADILHDLIMAQELVITAGMSESDLEIYGAVTRYR